MAELDKDLTAVFSTLDSLLAGTNLDKVSADGVGREDLPDGYYLSELTKAKLTVSKSSGNPMIVLEFKTTEDGFDVQFDAKGNVKLASIDKTSGRSFTIFYPLSDEQKVKRAIADLLKFEETEGQSLLTKEYFASSELLSEALDILVGMRIYVQATTSEAKDGTKTVWQNLVSWKRVKALGLPM